MTGTARTVVAGDAAIPVAAAGAMAVAAAAAAAAAAALSALVMGLAARMRSTSVSGPLASQSSESEPEGEAKGKAAPEAAWLGETGLRLARRPACAACTVGLSVSLRVCWLEQSLMDRVHEFVRKRTRARVSVWFG